MKKLFFLLLLTTISALAADVKISQLPLGGGSSVGINDSFPYVQASNLTTKRLTLFDIVNIPLMTQTYAPIANPVFTGTVTAPMFVGPLTGTATGNTTITPVNHGVVMSSATNAMTTVAPDASTSKTLISGGLTANPSWGILSIAGGGTGQTSFGVGLLHSNGSALSSSAVSLTADVSGVLPIANGGTNNSSAYTAGSVIFSNGTSLTQNNSNLFWDDTNKRLGIGQFGATPSAPIDVHSTTDIPLFQGNYKGAQGASAGAGIELFANSGAAMNSGNRLGYYALGGAYNPSNARTTSSYLAAFATENWSGSQSGSNLIFYTTLNGTNTPGAAVTIGNDKSVTLSGLGTGIVHSSSVGLLSSSAVSLTADVSGVLPLANGGTNNSASASAGSVIYSDATKHAYTAVGSSNQLLTSNGTSAPSWTTATYPSTTTANQLLYSSAANTVGGLTSANTAALVTSSSGVPSFTSGTTANRLLRTDGTTVSFAQAALATDVSGTLPIANGGTGQTSFVSGIIHSNGSALSSSAVSLTADVSGTLPIANGGTNNGSLAVTAGAIIYSDGTKLMNSGAGTSGQVLTSGGAGAPTWTSPLSNPMTTGGDMIYGGASGAATRLANGSAFQLLQSAGGTSAPTWATIPWTASATISSTGVVSSEVSDFISGNCSNSAGTATCTFTGSFWSANPNCQVTIIGDVTGGSLGAVSISSQTTSSVVVKQSTAGVGNVSRDFSLVCNGFR